MRVTNRMMTNSLLDNLRKNSAKLEKAQNQVASGKRFTRPSDDPAGASLVLSISVEAAQNQQYLRNLERARAWLGSSEAALSDLTNVVQRARELAIQASNDTMSPIDRQNTAKEIEALLEHAVQVANTRHEGEYVFAGLRTDAIPFTLGPGPLPATVTYNGDSGDTQRGIGPNLTLTVNTKAEIPFQGFFTTLIGLRDDLNAGANPKARVDELNTDLDSIVALSTEVGARMNRVDLTSSRLEDIELNLTGLRSQTEDVELDAAAVELMAQQTIYQASLAAGAKVVQPSLLDYLR